MPSNKKSPPHPGEVLLKKFLEPLGISQRQFASHLGWTYARLNEIINLHRGITSDTALALSESLGTEPEYWLTLQLHWDLWGARQTHTPVKPIHIKKK
jgi:addiction module HigA family antidote